MTDLKKTILLVSADRTATGSLEKLLELNGYRAWVSTTLAASLSEIRRRPPMLILLDRQILATEGGRRDQFPPAIPIIVLQPFDKSCGQDECLTELDAGFDLVFCSPHSRELLAHIRAIRRLGEPSSNSHRRNFVSSINFFSHRVSCCRGKICSTVSGGRTMP
jgi:DNA-binding response OmpR family regulator